MGTLVEKLRAMRYLGQTTCRLEQLIGPLSDSSPFRSLELQVPRSFFPVQRLNERVVPGDFDRYVFVRRGLSREALCGQILDMFLRATASRRCSVASFLQPKLPPYVCLTSELLFTLNSSVSSIPVLFAAPLSRG